MTSTSSSESASAITISRSTPAASNSSTIAGSSRRSVDGRGDLERFEITALVGGGARMVSMISPTRGGSRFESGPP